MKWFFSFLCGIFTYLFGAFDFLFSSVILLFGLHFFLALFYDYKRKQNDFEHFILRFFKLFGYLSILIVSGILDQFFSSQDTIRNFLLVSFLSHEVLSILHYCVLFGLPVPTFFFTILQNMLDTLPKEEIPIPPKEKK